MTIARDSTLSEHINRDALEELAMTITDLLMYGANELVTLKYDASNLQPTPRAAWLAANAAVTVLLAHEIGQEVARDSNE